MWTVEYEGHEIDVDPLNFTMADWQEIEQRAGVNGIQGMVAALAGFDPGAWRAAYWTGMRRAGHDPGPFGDFAGPNGRQILGQSEPMLAFVKEVGELIGAPDDGPKDKGSAPANGGSGGSPEPSDTPPTSST